MIDLSEIIVTLWFYPATALLLVLLFAVCWFLYSLLASLLSLFKPVAGQKRKAFSEKLQNEDLA